MSNTETQQMPLERDRKLIRLEVIARVMEEMERDPSHPYSNMASNQPYEPGGSLGVGRKEHMEAHFVRHAAEILLALEDMAALRGAGEIVQEPEPAMVQPQATAEALGALE